MKQVHQVMQIFLVLAIGVYLVCASEEPSQLPSSANANDVPPRKPSPEEIAASMNTFWDWWDEDHCKNICEASWLACRLRQCDDVPGVRRPDEL